eukprot:CAMPEP_0183342184 /NCGR_PEP_ID=MMETSP0164_2-20130417/8338_1 /TAXON_ID=221442 /ORGANISM="Coccolithus pelagicus ssp braarudi, Strain PLY182g" /LENGTH=323 /DNA_ID=CAMNT_0025512697 /DNA_START=286 /DNA_END=1260 /DNA_ORIENTATION=-
MRRCLLVLLVASVSAFAITPSLSAKTFARPLRPRPAAPLHLRGGTTAVHASALTGAITGAYAIPAAAGISAVAGSLAYIRQAYIFSLSYGLSMLGIGGAVLLASPASPLLSYHAWLVTAYGARLFAFLFWRQRFQAGYDGEARLRALDKTPRLQRTPIILSTAFFYALMASPLLFHLKAAPLAGAAATVSACGCALAAVGLVYEAVADQQKSLFKIGLRAAGKPDELYTGGVYGASRHANYMGEIAFWVGSFVAGLPAVLAAGLPLHVRALRAVASGLGLAGIVFIMTSATKRLEGRQADKWGSTNAYQTYVQTSNSLLPKLL